MEKPTITSSENNPPKTGSWGVGIAIALILILIVVGALYAWGKRISENTAPSIKVETSVAP